jgi:hypothetical protein
MWFLGRVIKIPGTGQTPNVVSGRRVIKVPAKEKTPNVVSAKSD